MYRFAIPVYRGYTLSTGLTQQLIGFHDEVKHDNGKYQHRYIYTEDPDNICPYMYPYSSYVPAVEQSGSSSDTISFEEKLDFTEWETVSSSYDDFGPVLECDASVSMLAYRKIGIGLSSFIGGECAFRCSYIKPPKNTKWIYSTIVGNSLSPEI